MGVIQSYGHIVLMHKISDNYIFLLLQINDIFYQMIKFRLKHNAKIYEVLMKNQRNDIYIFL